MLIPTEKQKRQCKICSKKFVKQNNLNEHVAAIHQGRKYRCPADGCNSLYTSAFRLKDHYKKSHTPPMPDVRSTIVYDSERGLVPGEEAKDALIIELRNQIGNQKNQIESQESMLKVMRRNYLRK